MAEQKIVQKKLKLKTDTDLETNDEGEKVSKSLRCRKCQQTKRRNRFTTSFDHWLDGNGMMSICNDCICEIYDGYLLSEKDQNKATVKLCRLLNWMYRPESIDKVNEQLADGRRKGHFAIMYHYHLAQWAMFAANHRESGGNSVDLTFVEPPVVIKSQNPNMADEDSIMFWGEGLEKWEYDFLNNEYMFFKEGHKADLPSEIDLLKEVCYKNLEIKKLRLEGKPVDSYVKSKQELFKSLAISPQFANTANSGKALDTFGNWVADIERETPAQWLSHEKKDLFRDVDDPEKYFLRYFVSPLKTFILQSKNWSLEHDDLVDGLENDESDEYSTEEEK